MRIPVRRAMMGNTKAWAVMCQIGMGLVLALGLMIVFTATVFADGLQPDMEACEVSAVLCTTAPDIHESDNFYTEATAIPTDGTVQTHTFHVVADKDWVSFHVLAGQVYTVTTSQLSGDVDTVLQLYDTDGVTLFQENDDYLAGSRASRIVWTAPADGLYYARITHFDRTFDPRSSSVCGCQYLVNVDRQQVLRITSSGRDLNDGLLKPGDAVEYTVTVWNVVPSVQTNMVITNPIPVHTTYVTGSVQATQGRILEVTPLVISVGNVEARERATVTFQVTVDPSSGGEMIVSQALARSDQQNRVIHLTHITERVANCLYLPFVAMGSGG
jgi:uncharacterized repeat protein (TIGR01451 family)